MDLTPLQETALEVFRSSPLAKKFYWTGGTLLAHYYLKHRLSFDLDWFSEQKFYYEELLPFLKRLKIRIKPEAVKEHKIYDRWEFIIIKKQEVRLDFVYYNHEKKRLKPLLDYRGIKIDSLEDIAANKVVAYFDRNQPKDLFDLYWLLQKKFSVKQLTQLVQKKFGLKFSELMFWGESAKSLPLLETLTPYLPHLSPLRQQRLIKKIQEFFLNQGKRYLDSRL